MHIFKIQNLIVKVDDFFWISYVNAKLKEK